MIEMADFTDGFLQELDSLRGADANLAGMVITTGNRPTLSHFLLFGVI